MEQDKKTIFEKHSGLTMSAIIVFLFIIVYSLSALKIFNNAYTEYENKSIKTILHQYYVSKIIDNNIGRFIKLREHRPNEVHVDRPSRNYLIKNDASHSLARKYYQLSIDQYGFIGPSDIHQVPDLSLVFLGGSTTECFYMEQNERFPYLVGRALELKLNKKINSYNGGVSANESMHSLNVLLNKVLALKPNVVVLMHNVNDLNVLRSYGSYHYPHSLKSHVQTSKNIFTRHEFVPVDMEINEQAICREFADNLKTFIAICQIRGIQPVLMTQANRVEHFPLYHEFNQIVRDIGKREQVLVIDLAKEIPATPVYLYDSYHYTAQGSQLAAQMITSQLLPLLQ